MPRGGGAVVPAPADLAERKLDEIDAQLRELGIDPTAQDDAA